MATFSPWRRDWEQALQEAVAALHEKKLMDQRAAFESESRAALERQKALAQTYEEKVKGYAAPYAQSIMASTMFCAQ